MAKDCGGIICAGCEGCDQDQEKKVVKRLLIAAVIVKRQGVAYAAKVDLGKICRACGRLVEEGSAKRICAKCQAAAEAAKGDE